MIFIVICIMLNKFVQFFFLNFVVKIQVVTYSLTFTRKVKDKSQKFIFFIFKLLFQFFFSLLYATLNVRIQPEKVIFCYLIFYFYQFHSYLYHIKYNFYQYNFVKLLISYRKSQLDFHSIPFVKLAMVVVVIAIYLCYTKQRNDLK